MYKTLVLLSIRINESELYFVVEGCSKLESMEELQRGCQYFYEEHTCPLNFIPILMISYQGDLDPHGVFTFVEAVWQTTDFNNHLNDDYLIKVWPQLAEKKTPAIKSV